VLGIGAGDSDSIPPAREAAKRPGNEAEAAGLLDAFLERANTQARLAQVAA